MEMQNGTLMPDKRISLSHDAPYCKRGKCSMKELSERKGGVEWCDREAVRGSVWARFHHWCLKRKAIVFFQYVVP